MCGLFGWSLSEEAAAKCDLHALATLLAFQANARGDESWGVLKITPDATTQVLKDVGSIRRTCKIKNILAPTVVGHTRKATTGKVTQENAHPFTHGKIIGAHNGFIWDHEALNKEHNRQFNVDSQHLIAHIAEDKPVDELGGNGTVSYIHTDNPCVVYLGRGAGSDLAVYGIGTVEKPIGVVWASIGFWVKDALDMAGLEQHFTYTTHLQSLYKVEHYELYEAGKFLLGPSRKRVNEITHHDHQSSTWSGYPMHGYRGRTLFDSKDYDKTNLTPKPELTALSKRDIDELPEQLKKKIKKSVSWRLGKQRKLLRQLGAVMHATIGERWLPLMRRMLGA